MPFFEDDPKEDKGFFMAFRLVCGEWYDKRCENIPVVIFREEKKAVNKRGTMPNRMFLLNFEVTIH